MSDIVSPEEFAATLGNLVGTYPSDLTGKSEPCFHESEAVALIRERDAQIRAEAVSYAREFVARVADRSVLIRLSALKIEFAKGTTP